MNKSVSREFLIRYKKKSHSKGSQVSEQVAQISWNVFGGTLNGVLDNWSHLNCPQSWFCFELDIRSDNFIYSIILLLQKLCILECLDNREARGTANSLESH